MSWIKYTWFQFHLDRTSQIRVTAFPEEALMLGWVWYFPLWGDLLVFSLAHAQCQPITVTRHSESLLGLDGFSSIRMSWPLESADGTWVSSRTPSSWTHRDINYHLPQHMLKRHNLQTEYPLKLRFPDIHVLRCKLFSGFSKVLGSKTVMTLYRFLVRGGLHSLKTLFSCNPTSQTKTHAILGYSFWLGALP